MLPESSLVSVLAPRISARQLPSDINNIVYFYNTAPNASNDSLIVMEYRILTNKPGEIFEHNNDVGSNELIAFKFWIIKCRWVF